MKEGINLIQKERLVKKIFPKAKNFVSHLDVDYMVKIDMEAVKKLEEFIKTAFDNLREIGYEGLFIGLSGGIDSAVCATLARRALGPKRVRAVIVDARPYTITDEGYKATMALTKKFNINTKILKVNKTKFFNVNPEIAQIYRRPTTLFGLASIERYIKFTIAEAADYRSFAVISTLDRTERLLCTETEGFSGHVQPLYNFYKSEVYAIGAQLGLPKSQLELKPGCPMLPFEGPFNASVQALDSILYLMSEKGMNPDAVAKKYGLERRWVHGLDKRIRNQSFRMNTQEFAFKR